VAHRSEMSTCQMEVDQLFDEAKASGSVRLGKSRGLNLTRRSFLLAGSLCVCCQPELGLADAPMVKRQAPGFYRLTIGDFEVTSLSDGTNLLPVTKLLQGDPARLQQMLKRNYLGDLVETSHNSFLVNTGTKLILVDAGAGTVLGPSTGHLLNNLRASGYLPEQLTKFISPISTLIISAV